MAICDRKLESAKGRLSLAGFYFSFWNPLKCLNVQHLFCCASLEQWNYLSLQELIQNGPVILWMVNLLDECC